jgi:hypothetical protein
LILLIRETVKILSENPGKVIIPKYAGRGKKKRAGAEF